MIADRYADAIFQAAQDLDHKSGGGSATETIDRDLASVAEMLATDSDLARLWKHPVIATSDKKDMAKQLFNGRIHPLALNLIMLLFDKKRGVLFEQAQQSFRERYNATRRRATVKVTSAMPLDASQADGLRQQLASQLAKEVEMETAVDPALIGGVIVQIEDQVIDGSVRGRLEALRLSLN